MTMHGKSSFFLTIGMISLAACSKEFHAPAPAAAVVYEVDSLSYELGWNGETLDLANGFSSWLDVDPLCTLEVAALHVGDRLIAVQEVGLQMNAPCADEVNVPLAMFLHSGTGVEALVDSTILWSQASEQITHITMIGELEITPAMASSGSIVEAFVLPWSSVCAEDGTYCYITERSLELLIVHAHD